MEKLKQLIEKKKKNGESISPLKAESKSGVLSDLVDQMHGMGGDKLRGLKEAKQVTVASNSGPGLTHGLDKAKEIVNHMPMGDESEEDASHEGLEDPGEEEMEGEVPDNAMEEGNDGERAHDLISMKQEIESLKQQIAHLSKSKSSY